MLADMETQQTRMRLELIESVKAEMALDHAGSCLPLREDFPPRPPEPNLPREKPCEQQINSLMADLGVAIRWAKSGEWNEFAGVTRSLVSSVGSPCIFCDFLCGVSCALWTALPGIPSSI